ncbi:MAG: fibronectin type III domain-containing protein, partial [Nonlabens sp.]|nr:fibronectin type III domain-containing protein [Nonlabens sp.]
MNVSLAGLEYALFSTCGTELLCGGLSNTAPNLIFGLTEGATYRVAIWRDGTSSLSSTVCFQDGPTCINPDTLTASNITDTTAELGWRDVNALNTTASASFEVEYGVGTFAQGSGTTVLSPVGNPTTITGLTANTIYNYYVRANCGGGGFSVWSGPFGFTTQVGPHSFPLLEDFESDFSFFANASGNSTNFAISTAYFHTGTKSAANAHTSNNTNNLVETGILDLSSTNNPELSFWHIAKTEGTWDKCFIQISINGGNTYIDLPASAYQGSATDYGTRGYFHEDSYAIWGTTGSTPDNGTWWQQETFSLAAYKVPNVRLRFRLTSDGSTNRAGWFLDDIEIKEAPVDYIWDGMAWNITPEGAITANDNMTVQAGGMASLTGAVMVGNLTLEMGAALEADNGNIMVAQNVVNNGSITGSGQVVLNAGDATVSGTGSMTNLTVGATGIAVMNGMQTISQQLDVISGGALDANGNLTLSSNAMGTARVDAVDTGAITGNVNVERFIPAGNRAYRFIGSTVTGPSIFNTWQEAGVNTPGFGVQVTGTVGTVGTVNAVTGHDETGSGASSLFKWNAASQAWEAVTNTRTETLTAGQYYRLFVRGDRMTDLSTNASATSATTLRASGTLLTGPMTVTPAIAAGGFFALANPYQSKVDMSLATTTGTTAFMYYWDPNLGMNGSYSAINITSGVGTAGVATNILDAGQAVFFEDDAATSSVTISEASKVAGNTNGGVFSTPASQQALRLKLYQTSRLNNGLSECDGLYLDFDATHNLGLDINDATKLYGANANIAIAKPTGQLLSVESRTLP